MMKPLQMLLLTSMMILTPKIESQPRRAAGRVSPCSSSPRALLEAMTRTMSQLIDQLIANRIKSRTLATLRDTLLPKLLSGELSVAEATGNRDLQVQPGMPKT